LNLWGKLTRPDPSEFAKFEVCLHLARGSALGDLVDTSSTVACRISAGSLLLASIIECLLS
jgi:hypothetical protein